MIEHWPEGLTSPCGTQAGVAQTKLGDLSLPHTSSQGKRWFSALLVPNLPSQNHVAVSFPSPGDFPVNRASLGTGQVSGYGAFLAQELLCTDSLSRVFDREGWLLGLFWFTIGDFVIISCVSLHKPCRCTTWVKYKRKPPAVLQPEV